MNKLFGRKDKQEVDDLDAFEFEVDVVDKKEIDKSYVENVEDEKINNFEQKTENKIEVEDSKINVEEVNTDLDNLPTEEVIEKEVVYKEQEDILEEKINNVDAKEQEKATKPSLFNFHKKQNQNEEKTSEIKEKFSLNSLSQKVKSIGNNIVNNIEQGIENIGDNATKKESEKQSVSENFDELKRKYDKLNQNFKQMQLTVEQLEKESGNAAKVDIVLSENLSIDLLISKMEQSGSFMKQIAYYLKNEVNNVVENYIDENFSSTIEKIKKIKLEELQVKHKLNITLADLEEKILGFKKDIIIQENDISSKKEKIAELERQIQNENETLNNIAEENNKQNTALLELRRNVEEERKRTLGDLEKYKVEEKAKIDIEVQDYKNESKEKIKEGIDLELQIQIESKLKDFESMFKDLSKELKEQILMKLLNK